MRRRVEKERCKGLGLCYGGILSETRGDYKGFLLIFYGFMVFQRNIQKQVVLFVYFVVLWGYGKMGL